MSTQRCRQFSPSGPWTNPRAAMVKLLIIYSKEILGVLHQRFALVPIRLIGFRAWPQCWRVEFQDVLHLVRRYDPGFANEGLAA